MQLYAVCRVSGGRLQTCGWADVVVSLSPVPPFFLLFLITCVCVLVLLDVCDQR